jgi:hypothetical protein
MKLKEQNQLQLSSQTTLRTSVGWAETGVMKRIIDLTADFHTTAKLGGWSD